MYSSPVSQPHQLARQALPKDNSDDAVSSLRHRLKALSASDDVEKRAQDDEAQRRERDQQQLSAGSLNTLEKPKFLDITTAFFRRPTTIAKDQPQKKAATPLVHQRRGATYQHRTGRDLQTRQQQPQQPQQQRAQSPPRGFNISDSPLARDLVGKSVLGPASTLVTITRNLLSLLDHLPMLAIMLTRNFGEFQKPLPPRATVCLMNASQSWTRWAIPYAASRLTPQPKTTNSWAYLGKAPENTASPSPTPLFWTRAWTSMAP